MHYALHCINKASYIMEPMSKTLKSIRTESAIFKVFHCIEFKTNCVSLRLCVY